MLLSIKANEKEITIEAQGEEYFKEYHKLTISMVHCFGHTNR